MKLERLSNDKIRVFLTFDDLRERGIQKEDMWNDIPKVHELFNEMMNSAYEELGFEVSGPLAVEIFAMPAQGMVVIVTKSKLSSTADDDEDEDLDDILEMQVTLEHTDRICYVFRQFEDVLGAAKILQSMEVSQGTLFHYKDRYVLHMESDDFSEKQMLDLISVLSEYGDAVSYTKAVMEEYGQTVIEADAVTVLCKHFH
jgi:adapter protein MecA 1/2